MTTNTKSERDATIQRAKRRVEVLTLVSDALDDDPEFIGELRGFIGLPARDNGQPTQKRRAKKRRRSTNYETIVKQYVEASNVWMTLKELAEATEVAVASIRDAVYKSNIDNFEKRDLPGHGLIKQFRLKPSIITEMKGAAL